MATAYVLINCELGSEESVISELKSIEGVVEVHGTFGAYDIMAKVESSQVEALRGCVYDDSVWFDDDSVIVL